MITSALFFMTGALITAVIAVLSPLGGDAGFPAGVDSAVTAMSLELGKANVFIPLSALYDVIIFIVAFELILLMFYLIRFIISHLPFIGGK